MKRGIIDQINNLNKRFYKVHASDFNRTRRVNWKGWDEFWPIVEESQQRIFRNGDDVEIYNVLDIGCGNGRFLDYLTKQSKVEFGYIGIDSSDELLGIARKRTGKMQNADFFYFDLIQDPKLKNFPSGSFDLIVAFGLLHHIPESALRMQLLRNFAGKLKDNGVLIFTLWQFMKSERMQKRIVSPEKVASIEKSGLEENDYFLDWNKTGTPRFCHNFSDEEIEDIKRELQNSGLTLLREYSADGKEGDLNKYLVFQK